MLSGGVCVCAHVCPCVFNHNACPFSMLKATFYGHEYTAKSQFGSPEEQLSTIVYPPNSILHHQNKITLYLVLSFGMKAGIF